VAAREDSVVPVYDDVAECYDATRGGEQRGDDFAAELDRRLGPADDPVLEVGVGTGVVALGLRRRGRTVFGVDIASAMLARAARRLGPTVVCGDARRLPFGSRSLPQAVSVWVAHSVDPPEAMFSDVFRVLRPGGRYLVCPTNRVAAGDPIEPILNAMFLRAESVHPTLRGRLVGAADILGWGQEAGFNGAVEAFEARSWTTSAVDEARAIRDRAWPALRGLDDRAFRAVTDSTFEALGALPDGPIVRTGHTDVVVLQRGG
jgi:ubiquinone/menaquinone biosynthesis C-methylase UbiE